MKYLDIPPTWLALFAAVAWVQARFVALNLSFGGGVVHWIGGGLIALGLIVIVLAAYEFLRNRTTIVPHQSPSALISGGVFAWSRNPIYLADGVILTGLILRWDAVVSILLIPLFIYLITNRFIQAEEQRMHRIFGSEFARYEQKVRRWV